MADPLPDVVLGEQPLPRGFRGRRDSIRAREPTTREDATGIAQRLPEAVEF
jgi:hypothetical protein